MEIKRYCAGTLTDENEDFYWDTLFSSIEDCEEWAINHNCTHIYDNVSNKFFKI